MSKCPCGVESWHMPTVHRKSPHRPYKKCRECGFSWGVKG